METLEIIPGFSVEPERLFYSVNVKIATKKVISFVKNKLKSLIMNHSYFYLNANINSVETRYEIYRLFSKSTVYKIYGFFEELRMKHKKQIHKLDDSLAKIIRVAVEDYVMHSTKFGEVEFLLNNRKKFQNICYQEFRDFFSSKQANYPKLYKKLKKMCRNLSAAEKMKDMEIEIKNHFELMNIENI